MILVDVSLKFRSFELAVAFSSDGGVVALFGRSGSGKSLTLSLIAGLARPDRGRICLHGRTLVDTQAGIFVKSYRRRVGLVFQDAQLFPHLSVRHNLMFGRWFSPRQERAIDVDSVIATLGIEHLLDRAPEHLSGGEKQRVAIGRALLSDPKILLMDEPLAALDLERKLEILPLIENVRDEFKVPIVYVSHALDEVARLASRVVVLNAGRVAAIGPPGQVLGKGESDSGANRFERSSVLTARVDEAKTNYGLTELIHPAGRICVSGLAGPPGRELRIVVKATDVAIATIRPTRLSVRTVLSGTLASIETDEGALATLTITLPGGDQLVALTTRMAVHELSLRCGDQVFALIKAVALDERATAAARRG
jgi:molybdate transport system ATP-binding protein